MLPQPRMIPRFGSGHGILGCGHAFRARSHISCVVCSLHSVRIWLIDSVVLQVAQFSLSSSPSMFDQYAPVLWVLCIVFVEELLNEGFCCSFPEVLPYGVLCL